MKKITRIAALLAAGALLFGAVGCSGDDDGDEKDGVKVTASVEPAIELEEGKDGTYVVTCTVTGDTFSANAKGLEVNEPIPADYLKLTASDSKVTISEVKVSEKFTDTVGKVSIKVAAADGAKSGTIKAELLKGTLTDTTDTVTATPISYTIKGDEGQQGGGDGTPDSWTFAGKVGGITITEGYSFSGSSSTGYTKSGKLTAIDSNATIIYENVELDGEEGNLTLTIANYAGTGVGADKSKATVKTKEALEAELTAEKLKTTLPSTVQYKSNSKGLVIKRDALKISGVKGSVKLAVKWGTTGNSSAANNRNLEVTVGADGETQEIGNRDKTSDAFIDDFDVEGGEDGVDVYIGASNEVYIDSITITTK